MGKRQIIGPQDYISMPWKNGLGTTVELLKQDLPEDGGFTWRLSMADVTTDGAFSNFKGYDRTLLLLEGEGMTLKIKDDQQIDLTNRLQAARFDGGDKTFATLHEGPIKDFNVMVSQSHCFADVIAYNKLGEQTIHINCDLLLVYVVEGNLDIRSQNFEATTVLEQHLLKLDNPLNHTAVLSGAAFIVVQITNKTS